MIKRTAFLWMFLASVPAEAQTRFEVAVGPQFGLQDSETPVSRGWIVSTAFEIDEQDYIVEGSWHRAGSAHERFWRGDPRERLWEFHSDRVLTLAAGVRSRDQDGPIAPFYQVLMGGIQAIWRTDYEYPASVDIDAENARCGVYDDGVLVEPCLRVPHPEFRERRVQGLMIQPGIGLDVRIRREVAVRVGADLLFIANRSYVGASFSRLSARVVIGWGR